MKITTWNVNGLRAVLRKGAWEWITVFQPDVLCLQEIRVRPDQLTKKQHAEMRAHEWSWNPAERPGYSGVATGVAGSAGEPAVKNGIGYDKFDVEGRVVQSDHEAFILFNIYFPNGSRDHSRVPYKLEFYEKLLELCDEVHAAGRRVILCGDFNTCHQEIDLAHPKSNSSRTGFLPEERAWIDKYLDHGFVDAWRALYPERIQYTWWHLVTRARERNVGWRLDYFLVSEELMDSVVDVTIHDEVMGSDHCPVTLKIE